MAFERYRFRNFVLDASARTVAGATIGEVVASVPPRYEDRVIRRRDDPVVPVGAIAVLAGNLAPGGAVIKHSAASPGLQQHEGRAIVFESVEDMTLRLDDAATGSSEGFSNTYRLKFGVCEVSND